MNKFQKIAAQMAKDDMKKQYKHFSIKELKNMYYHTFKKDKYTILKALDYKNWNKNCEF